MKDELPTRKGHHKKKRSGVRFAILAIIAIVLVAGGAYAAHTYGQMKATFSKSYSGIGSGDGQTIDTSKPVSVLLMGTDTGAFGRSDKGRTDTMMVVTVNPKTNKTTMVSIPRDTLADIKKTDGQSAGIEKINAAYTADGAGGAIKTVESLLNVPIQYYAIMNMGGLEKMVDAIGGIDVVVPFSWSDSHTHMSFKKGKAHLNGKRALGFARMRYEDPSGDYGRQKRQQQVITQIVKKVLDQKSPALFQKLLKLVANNMQTNLTFDDIVALAAHDSGAFKSITRSSLQGTGAYVGDAAFQIPSTDELNRVSKLLRKQLDLKAEKLDNYNTNENAQNVANGFDFSDGFNPTFTLYNGQVGVETDDQQTNNNQQASSN